MTHKNIFSLKLGFYYFQKEILMGIYRLLVMDLPTFPDPATENPFSWSWISSWKYPVSLFSFSSMSFNPLIIYALHIANPPKRNPSHPNVKRMCIISIQEVRSCWFQFFIHCVTIPIYKRRKNTLVPYVINIRL